MSARQTFPMSGISVSGSSSRWTLEDAAKCGANCYLRPCQLGDTSHIPASAFPMADVCRSPREAVLIVDDDSDVLEELAEMVRSFGYDVVCCSSATDFQREAQAVTTGCVLLDVKLPGQDGLAVQEWLKDANPTLPVIFVSGVRDIGTIVHCMKSGALDFMQKPISDMALSGAVNAAVGFSRKAYCVAESRKLIAALIGTLTPTELKVAEYISKGFPTKLVASELGRSENTVKIHRHRIFSKLKVSSAASVANLMRVISG